MPRSQHIRGSINRRLMGWMIGTTGLSLIAACAFFVTHDTLTGKRALVENAELLARVVAGNSAAALAVDDHRAAAESLAGLAAAKQVLAAVLYDARAQPFAQHLNPRVDAKQFAPPMLDVNGFRFAAGRLHLFQSVRLGGGQVGHIYLQLDTSALSARLHWLVGATALLILITGSVAAALSYRFRRQISQPLAALMETTQAVSDGDLSIDAPVSTHDEFGRLAETFNRMTLGLRNVVIQVRQSIGEVASVSRGLEERGTTLSREAKRQDAATQRVDQSVCQVIASIRDVNASAEQLAGTSQETSTSILEMDASIGEIAANMDQLTTAIDTTSASVAQLTVNIDQVVGSVETLNTAANLSAGRVHELSASVTQIKTNAAQSHALSADSSREASQGMAAVNETIAAMSEIASSFGELQQRVAGLAEKSQSIDAIVQVIRGVAQQTTLLSLNAAIIAAQAGEHGKAFGVVAEQVNALAERTHRSAGEIASLIRAVQEDTTGAVGAVEEGSARVERGVQRSNLAGEVLGRILEKTKHSTKRVSEIVDATAQQTEDLERVDHAVEEVQQIVGQINQATHDQNEATKEIAAAVANIRNLGISVKQSTLEQRRGSALITKAASEVAEMISDIASSTSAQQTSSETIQYALRIFTEVAAETIRTAEEINDSVATLSERATRLEGEIGRFKTQR
jgi:methyl-accepting chemotaxis protein